MVKHLMNYKTCKILNENFKLDEKFNVFLATKKKVQVTDGLEKGYIYAAMYFFDEVEKEVKKLEKIVRKNLDAIKLETTITDPPILLLELSRRVKDVIGDDSLDTLIKEIIAEEQRHIALASEPAEIEKYNAIKESILTETIGSLFDTIIKNSEKNDKGFKTAALAQNYVDKLTDRQKKLLSPAVKMVGYLNEVKLDDFEFKNNIATFQVFSMTSPFAAKEEAIKKKLKGLMEENE